MSTEATLALAGLAYLLLRKPAAPPATPPDRSAIDKAGDALVDRIPDVLDRAFAWWDETYGKPPPATPAALPNNFA